MVIANANRLPGLEVFDYTTDAMCEIDASFRKHKKVIVALTVKKILDEEIAKKLA